MTLPIKNITRTTFIPPGSIEHIIPASRGRDKTRAQTIDLMGTSRLVPGYLMVRTQGYRFHVVLLIRRGRLQFRADPHDVSTKIFSEGTLVFLPAGSWYMYGSDEELELVWFHLRPEAPEWHFLRETAMFSDHSDDFENAGTLVLMLYRELASPDRKDTSIAWYAERLIELCLLRTLRNFVAEPESFRRLRRLFSQIELALDKNWNVSSMARQCGMSESALFALSNQCFGCPPVTRLHELRMRTAANLLRNSAHKLDTIATMVGLGCGFSLSRAFHRYYGVSPRSYRNGNIFPLSDML